jgi:hypothetical protein
MVKIIQLDKFLSALILALTLAATSAWAQSNGASDVADLAHTDLAAGKKKMEVLGYEIVYSTKKVQHWWNEGSKTCVSLGIERKEIGGVTTLDKAECEKHLDAARAVYAGYSNGQANVHSPSLDREREKLSGQGYTAVYSLKHVAPGTGAEYWSNAESKKCVVMDYQTNDNAWVKTANAKPRTCVNPALGKSK